MATITIDSAEKQKRTYSAPALEKGFAVLELLASAPGGLTVTEIASGLGKSIGELFRIIVVMEQLGWLRRTPENDRYRVSYRLLEIAHRATPAQDLLFVTAPIAHDLAHAVNQSCHVVVRNEDKGLIILRQENPGITGFAVRLGAEVDLVAGCSGHVLLAFGREGLPKGLAPDQQGLLEQVITRVRAQGYERLPSARTRGVVDISCPIYGFGGYAVAAFTIPFLEVMDGSQLVTIEGALEQLKVAARRASQALGWTGEASDGRGTATAA